MAHKKEMTVMGRKVVHHSPAKFPASTDAQTADQFDQMLEQATARQKGTYGDSRQMMKPAQQESPAPAKKLDSVLDYLGRMGGRKK